MARQFLTPPQLPSGSSLPSSGAAGSLFFKSDESKIYVHDGTNWVVAQGSGGGGVTVSDTAPADPTEGTYWFDSTTAKSYIYYDSFWIEVGYSGGGYIVSETAPSNPSEGDVWFSTSEGVIYVYYDSYWIDPSTGGAAGVPAGGAADQVLVKASASDYDTEWSSALAAIDSIALDTAAAVTVTTGQMAWNAAEETLDIGLNADVTLQVGQETLMRVKNMTGVEIANGTAVQFAGVNGDQIQVAPAVADGSVDHHYMIGVTTEAIAHGESGFVTTQGLVRGLDTSTWLVGTILYIDPATPGGLTATAPLAPNLKCPIAAVTKSGPGTSGILMVRMEMGETLGDLHNVELTSPASGESLIYNATSGIWENALAGMGVVAVSSDITLSASNRYFVDTNAARTLTLPTSPSVGDEIWIIDQTGLAATNNITVNNGGSLINGVSDTLVIDVNGAVVALVYTGSTLGWRV